MSSVPPGAPKVSVIIPCYNLGQYVDEAVESVLAQTFWDVEIVIVNDGSTDPATNALLADYRRPRTRVVSTDNRGLAAARNLGIASSVGEYLCALDADDWLAPTYLEKAVGLLDDDGSIAFVSCWLRAFGSEEWVWRQERCDLATLLVECTVCTAALVRRSALLAVGGYDGAMPEPGYEDWDLWISLAERGFRGAILPEVLFHYRRRPDSMSTRCVQGESHQALMRYLVRKHEASYRTHLLDVLLRKEAELSDLLRSGWELEQELETRLGPELACRREEVEMLRRKLARAAADDGRGDGTTPRRLVEVERELEARREEMARLDAALRSARREIEDLRSSWSWRITRPLRTGYDRLRRWPGRS